MKGLAAINPLSSKCFTQMKYTHLFMQTTNIQLISLRIILINTLHTTACHKLIH